MRRALLLLALIAGVVGPAAASVSLGLAGDSEMLWPVSWLAWAPVGYVILLRRPGNGVGAATLLVGTTMGVSFLAYLAIAETGGLSLDFRTWAEMVNLIAGVAPWLGIVWLLLVFPSGNLRGRGERWAGGAVIFVAIVAAAAFMVSSEPMDATGVPSPLAIPALDDLSAFIVVGPGFFLVVVLLLVSLVLLVLRMRRSSGVEREQFRWLFFGGLLFALVVLSAQFLPEDTPGRFLFLPAGWAIPVTIGVAMTRYRLYEIDRIISRTVTYTLVVALLAAVFFGLVTVLAGVLSPDQP
ncbi:MAG: hypothetical protein ACRDVL_04230, partial [Acidimicrobiia bacterium]